MTKLSSIFSSRNIHFAAFPVQFKPISIKYVEYPFLSSKNENKRFSYSYYILYVVGLKTKQFKLSK